MNHPHRLRQFLAGLSQLIDDAGDDEARVLSEGETLLSALVRHDDWLPDAFTREASDGYRQYLLYCDPRERFSVVSFVWGPGQRTPVHDHTVWGLIGMLRGAELCHEYQVQPGQALACTGMHRLETGEVDKVSPRIGDVHAVSNALADRTSISIHVYGANIGAVRRHVYDPDSGQPRPFVSGYHNTVLPNVWDGAQGTDTTTGTPQ